MGRKKFVQGYVRFDWHHESNVIRQIELFLRKQGYQQIFKENANNWKGPGDSNFAIAEVSPAGVKEIIHMRGYPSAYKPDANGEPKLTAAEEARFWFATEEGSPMPPLRKLEKPYLQAQLWFTELLLSNIYGHKNLKATDNFVVGFGFPDVPIYKRLIVRVEDYFTFNNIDHKLYLVREDGKVIVSNLNSNLRNAP